MKFVYLSFLVIFLVICLALATEFESAESHNEDFHDEVDDADESMYSDGIEQYSDVATKLFSSLTPDTIKNHIKDIIRGFSDKGFEDCDKNADKYLVDEEVGCFIAEKMGFSLIGTLEQVIQHHDKDQNGKLDSDDVKI
eukprot:NP_509436.1 Uncharacterized protein CELE_F16F9.3 [Caenorhabditis elegans]